MTEGVGYARTGPHGDRTLAAYQAAAHLYVARTERSRAELQVFMEKFVAQVRGGRVLELGSGPGWDAQHLDGMGVHVERTDGTPAFVDLMRADGFEARLLNIVTDDLGGPYDGIFANAVLLHLTREEFLSVLRRARRSSRVFAFTLKEGDGSGWSTAKLELPRYFTYWREPAIRAALNSAGWSVSSIEQVGDSKTQSWLFVLAT